MVKKKKPIMVFLMETKCRQNKMEHIGCNLGLSNMLVVDYVGKSGGLALLWANKAGVEIKNYSCRHINVTILATPSRGSMKIHGFLRTPRPY